MERLLTSVHKFSLGEMNAFFFSTTVNCIVLVTLANSTDVRTASVLHVKAPAKSFLGCIHAPMDKSSELCILREN